MGQPHWTWPEYKSAKLPQRVQMVITAKDGSGRVVGHGMKGTARRRVRQGGAPAMRVEWDNGYSGLVTAPARELSPIREGA